jgi:6-phosphogluconolactonase (cycloisomerase 2 family)
MRPKLFGVCLLVIMSFSMSGCVSGDFLSGTNSHAEPEYFYGRGPQNVLVYQVDTVTGYLTPTQTYTFPGSTYEMGQELVATSPPKFLYGTDDLLDAIEVFSIGSDGSLSPISNSPFTLTNGSTLAPNLGGLALNPSGTALYSVGYLQNIEEFQIDPNTGALSAAHDVYNFFNGFPGQIFIPSAQYLYDIDENTGLLDSNGFPEAGIDEFEINESGGLTPLRGSPLTFPYDSYPGQAVTDPTETFIYLPLSGLGAVAGYARNPTTGEFTAIAGSPFATELSTASVPTAVAIHPSGRFLYAMNVADGSISGFAVDPDSGVLTPLAGSPFTAVYESNGPYGIIAVTRDPMAIDPSGAFLYVNTTRQQIAYYKINQDTGALTLASKPAESMPETVEYFTILQAP